LVGKMATLTLGRGTTILGRILGQKSGIRNLSLTSVASGRPLAVRDALNQASPSAAALFWTVLAALIM
jgi:hypothetical protein